MKIEVQAVAEISVRDTAQAIAKLEPHQISDFMLMIVDEMHEPKHIMTCAERIKKSCILRFGPQTDEP